MGNTSTVSELKAVMLIKRFRHDLERNFDQMVEVESKICALAGRTSNTKQAIYPTSSSLFEGICKLGAAFA